MQHYNRRRSVPFDSNKAIKRIRPQHKDRALTFMCVIIVFLSCVLILVIGVKSLLTWVLVTLLAFRLLLSIHLSLSLLILPRHPVYSCILSARRSTALLFKTRLHCSLLCFPCNLHPLLLAPLLKTRRVRVCARSEQWLTLKKAKLPPSLGGFAGGIIRPSLSRSWHSIVTYAYLVCTCVLASVCA